MNEKVAKLGLQREADFMYFTKAGEVWRKAKATKEVERIPGSSFIQEEGYLYFVDPEGDVARTVHPSVRDASAPPPRPPVTFAVAFKGMAKHVGKARFLTVDARRGGMHRGRHPLTIFNWSKLEPGQRDMLIESRLSELAAQFGRGWAKRFVPFAVSGGESNPVPFDELDQQCDAVLLLDLQQGGAVVVLENPDSDEPVELSASCSELDIGE
jgi:hypothetical protein